MTTPKTFWAVVALLYMVVIYSIGLSWRYGAEMTQRVNNDTWLSQSGTIGDNTAYLSFGGGAPYVYRVAPIALAKALNIMGFSGLMSYVTLNTITAWAFGMLMTAYSIAYYRATPIESIFVGLLSLTVVSIPSTILLPMVDIPTMLATVLLVWSIRRGNALNFAIVAVLAVATKEVLLAGGFLWFAWHNDKPLKMRLVGIVPILAFMGIRVALGGNALEVNYGFDLAKGEIPSTYIERLLSVGGFATLISRSVLGLGALWLGLISAKKDRFTLVATLSFVLPTVLATWLLSSRIARPLGIEVVILAPAFMLYMRRFYGYTTMPEV